MRIAPLARTISHSLVLLLISTICCMVCLTATTVGSLQAISQDQKVHLESFVSAKRLTAGFEREILNARIFFIYFVTIQKPESEGKGWERYGNAQKRLEDLAILVGKHEELADLRAPVATLQRDLLSYNEALTATIRMVRGGVLKGPRYDAQVKDWAARGAVLVEDVATVESLCFKAGDANTAATMAAVESARTKAFLLFGVNILFCLLLTLLLKLRIGRVLRSLDFPHLAGQRGAGSLQTPSPAI